MTLMETKGSTYRSTRFADSCCNCNAGESSPSKRIVRSQPTCAEQLTACRRTRRAQLLLPHLKASDVVLLDNLPVHQSNQVEVAVASIKGQVLWLPAYSLDFSPVEPFWSKVKTLVRGKGPRTANEVDTALSEAIKAVSLDNIDGWFRHCGY